MQQHLYQIHNNPKTHIENDFEWIIPWIVTGLTILEWKLQSDYLIY